MLLFFRRVSLFALIATGWLLALGMVAALVFSYLLPQDLSLTTERYAQMVQVAFFGRVLTFQIGLALAMICAVAACLRRWWLTLFSMLPAVIVFAPALLNCLPKHPPSAIGATVRIMSVNLKYFYSDGDRIISQIRLNDPQLLLIQDYTPFSQKVIDGEFAHDYPYRMLVPNGGCGLAIYSRLPFEDGPPRSVFDDVRRQMRTVIRVNGRSVALYNVHPYSPRTRQRILSNRLATIDLVKQVQAEKIPVILAGDFNFTAETPNESAMKTIGLQDGFDLVGIGRGSTWPESPAWMQWLPGVRIDHVFISQELTCTHFEVGGYTGSDHLPIVAEVGFAAQ